MKKNYVLLILCAISTQSHADVTCEFEMGALTKEMKSSYLVVSLQARPKSSYPIYDVNMKYTKDDGTFISVTLAKDLRCGFAESDHVLSYCRQGASSNQDTSFNIDSHTIKEARVFETGLILGNGRADFESDERTDYRVAVTSKEICELVKQGVFLGGDVKSNGDNQTCTWKGSFPARSPFSRCFVTVSHGDLK